MNAKEKLILGEYGDQLEDFKKLEKKVERQLEKIVSDSDIRIYAINHRIKERESLAGKLERKGDKYSSLSDITDILGFRIVCFFSDDVDVLAKKIEENFKIDWDESIDKRKFLNTNSFGYLSVHYICSLDAEKLPRNSASVPDALLNKRFEIQMCSLLQHVWAVMEHDLGYKTKFGVPAAVSRDFSRLAGLLEIADEHFVRIRDNVASYTEKVHEKIVNDNAGDIVIDSVSLDEYMHYSKNMRAFLQSIANMSEAEISDETADNYIDQLAWLNIKTLGDLQNMLMEDSSLAFQMARNTLAVSDLDILSSSVALRFLCHAELINKNYTEREIVDFFKVSINKKERAERYARELLKNYGQNNS